MTLPFNASRWWTDRQGNPACVRPGYGVHRTMHRRRATHVMLNKDWGVESGVPICADCAKHARKDSQVIQVERLTTHHLEAKP